jgi:hypothetical protein
MNHLLARRKSSSSVRGRQLEARSTAPSSSTPSDQKPREAKSSPYARPSYETALAAKGSFMGKSNVGITDASRKLCRTLLETEQSTPAHEVSTAVRAITVVLKVCCALATVDAHRSDDADNLALCKSRLVPNSSQSAWLRNRPWIG